ncbi:hypothetical protein BH09MYX1_BH09MYX1_35370 [soil metagenome]
MRPLTATLAALAAPLLVLSLAACSSDPDGVDPDGDASPDAIVAVDSGKNLDAGAKADAVVDAGGPVWTPPADAGASSTRHTPKQLGTTTAPNGFWEYLPPGLDKTIAMPLLVFWHGIGENGDGKGQLTSVPANGPPNLIKTDKWPNTRPFIVLSPQHSGGGCPSASEIDAFITWSLANYKIDPKRIYLSGLSCGAIGSWDYLGTHKSKDVAASVLVCGNPGDPNNAGSTFGRAGCAGLGSLAIWSFHGDKDPTVPFAPDEATMTKLLACPAPPRRDAKWTPIANGGHAIWGPVYDLSGGYGDVYAWLLANPKP